MFILLVLLLYNTFFIEAMVNEVKLLSLQKKLLQNPLDYWLFKDQYNSLDELLIDYTMVNKSVSYPTPSSSRVKNLVFKALNGIDVNVAILGGSISAGATLYKEHHQNKVYFRVLEHFWNELVEPVTGSRMVVHDNSIGAIGSDFYSYCLNNYVLGNSTDLVIWELSANDYHRFDNRDVPPTLPLELLTRNIYRLEKRPLLIYAHFFRGKDHIEEQQCNNLETEGATYLSRYYWIPTVSWRKLICKKLVMSQNNAYFTKVFAADNSHPSLLGHAQMGFLFLHLVRKIFLQVIDDLFPLEMQTSSLSLALPPVVVEPLTKTVYTKSQMVSDDPICFTFNIPSSGRLPFNQRDVVEIIKNDGYTISTAHGFTQRKDRTEGLRTRAQNAELRLRIQVPMHSGDPLKEWMILIGSYSNLGGAVFFLDDSFSRIIETDKYSYGSIVAAVATHVKPGTHILVIKSLKKGFFLSSIMLG
ncbi:uncharacterized protein [Clytia hemisphaerica]|uniref:Uncharacterized protein n=1 Tax=Clytia hemisphaerica TaxID=252671 RepID=A0A7M6DJT1_9CNID